MRLNARSMKSRVGPVRCGLCGDELASLTSLVSHLLRLHANLSARERGESIAEARRRAGWIVQRGPTGVPLFNPRAKMAPSRIGPVRCPRCSGRIVTLGALRSHLVARHADLSQRDRSLVAEQARRAAGWEAPQRVGFGVSP